MQGRGPVVDHLGRQVGGRGGGQGDQGKQGQQAHGISFIDELPKPLQDAGIATRGFNPPAPKFPCNEPPQGPYTAPSTPTEDPPMKMTAAA